MTFSMTRAPQIQDQILLILLQVSRTLGEFRIVIGGLFHNLSFGAADRKDGSTATGPPPTAPPASVARREIKK